jgi:hypothetical protein
VIERTTCCAAPCRATADLVPRQPSKSNVLQQDQHHVLPSQYMKCTCIFLKLMQLFDFLGTEWNVHVLSDCIDAMSVRTGCWFNATNSYKQFIQALQACRKRGYWIYSLIKYWQGCWFNTTNSFKHYESSIKSNSVNKGVGVDLEANSRSRCQFISAFSSHFFFFCEQ